MARELTTQERRKFEDYLLQLRETEVQEQNPYAVARSLLSNYHQKIGGTPSVDDFYKLMLSYNVPLAGRSEAKKILDYHNGNFTTEDSETEDARYIY